MARGPTSPAASAPLPKVSFTRIEEDDNARLGGVHDIQARSYGYNDFSDFKRPEHYIRFIEPLESDLAIQVEYDMDEQDQEWLDAVNADRKKEQLDRVSYEFFEIVMDKLEKEWFDLTKNIPKADFALPSEDSTCAICDDSEGENSNAIVFCDGCNLAVHQDCYGVPYIPEGQWLCRKCTVSPENPVSCILCPNEGGAFKQTSLGDWVHLLCAIWVPETRVANEVFMEPVTGVERISKQRWKLRCSICNIRGGACIQCAKTTCFLAFHTTCARKERLLLPMKSSHGVEPTTLTCFCEKHLPAEQQEIRLNAQANEEEAEDHRGSGKLSKSARAYAKTYKPGPPLVPALIVNRIAQYVGKVTVRKKLDFLYLMCKYWSLKREARRGAPLLKRLHLEPWTASGGSKEQSALDTKMKLDLLHRLKDDLESVRKLADQTRNRETQKLSQIETAQDVLSRYLFSHESPLRMAFERIVTLDRNGYFKSPVLKSEVPDYFDIVKRPMCWTFIDEKIDKHEYWDAQEFIRDVNLVLDNAILYNKPGTTFHRNAQRIRIHAAPILEGLGKLTFRHPECTAQGQHETKVQPEDEPSLSLIGDFELPIEILELLDSPDRIKDDADYELEVSPIRSLLGFELGKLKPKPLLLPPPARPPTKGKALARKPRKLTKKEREAQRLATAKLNAGPGFRDNEAKLVALGEGAPATLDQNATGDGLEPTGGSSVGPNVESARRPRQQPTMVLIPGDPPVVDDIDHQRSFKMFNEGWILPSDAKRGGRAPVDRQVVPPKKRPKTNRTKSYLSGSGALPPFSDQELDQEVPIPDEVMDIDDAPSSSKDRVTIEKPTRFVEEQGILVVEELDTPALRRNKNTQRRIEKRKAEKGHVVGSSPAKAKKSYVDGMESESSLSSLSPSESDEEKVEDDDNDSLRDFVRPPATILADDGSIPLEKLGMIVANEKVEEGTLVWAKTASYPWWPAVVYDEENPIVNDVPSLQGELTRKKHVHKSQRLYIVRFYDKTQSWQTLTSDKVRRFGDYPRLDEDMISVSSKMQKWKAEKDKVARGECRQAYRQAISEMETKEESINEAEDDR